MTTFSDVPDRTRFFLPQIIPNPTNIKLFKPGPSFPGPMPCPYCGTPAQKFYNCANIAGRNAGNLAHICPSTQVECYCTDEDPEAWRIVESYVEEWQSDRDVILAGKVQDEQHLADLLQRMQVCEQELLEVSNIMADEYLNADMAKHKEWADKAESAEHDRIEKSELLDGFNYWKREARDAEKTLDAARELIETLTKRLAEVHELADTYAGQEWYRLEYHTTQDVLGLANDAGVEILPRKYTPDLNFACSDRYSCAQAAGHAYEITWTDMQENMTGETFLFYHLSVTHSTPAGPATEDLGFYQDIGDAVRKANEHHRKVAKNQDPGPDGPWLLCPSCHTADRAADFCNQTEPNTYRCPSCNYATSNAGQFLSASM